MQDYDFTALNDKEFENITIDLLSIKLGVQIERFKAGKDGGVDGRVFFKNGEAGIIKSNNCSIRIILIYI